ncbi:N-terminal binuclear Zn cluster-containing protein [Trichoderma citrinoviride]|uniref:N-terminal binuclear Zn cluster-containing protein n=1 Tax=Trichoderma citrinoviride TaxID=58853 RepID=A0A2T4BBS6_9HYPO|nr:N-terminal binuclear Zn cluster-containing protein [Trichoderma citrinoviride]PTB66681.1 N-terminal binuclear Zn cluster-containing protein [Trichoderma citrinoviride]
MSSASPSLAIPSEIPRRRNGRPQACEPCRRRKVACDHRLPICSRCIRKNTPQSCRYLIQGRLVTPATSADGEPTVLSNQGQQPPATVQVKASPSTLENLSPREENVGYLGATSFPEFFRETQKHLDQVAGSEPARDGLAGLAGGGKQPSETSAGLARMAPDATAFEVALSVLRAIPTKEAAHFLLRRNVNPNDAWCRLALDRLHASLWSTLGHFLDGQRTRENMSQLALLLFQNGSKSLREDFTDPNQWFEAFSGANFRWEGLGLLFTFWTFGAASLSENGTAEQRKWLGHYNRRNLMQVYQNAVVKIVDLCRLSSCNNTMMVYLLHMHSLTESLITGDTGAEFWRHHAEAIALATFLGLHTPQSSKSIPEASVSVQAKRRVFCSIFNMDMVVSTLTGRPPLLSSRLCSTPLPLDVSDESLLNTKVRPHRLNEEGWNIEGKNLPATFLRAVYIISQIRSEILEIVLQAPHVTTTHNFDDLRRREMEAYSQFPIGLRFNNGDFNDPDVDASTLYMRLMTRLEHLSNLFFIERLSYKGRNSYSPDMLEISLEMITLTLSFWTQQNRLEGLQGDYEWLVMMHAAPAGGILCMELLKQPSGNEPPTVPTITKPMIIKQLSLLVGFLEWIGPGAPGAHLCNSIKTVVERVMEQALNPPPRPITQEEFDLTWDVSLSEDMHEFNFELLDTFDWLRLPPSGL